MPYAMNVTETVSVDGSNYTNLTSLSADNRGGSAPASIPAAKGGTLTTRGSSSAGTVTLTGGHGLTTGLVDVFWSGGSRANCDATITVNACVLTNGAGDDLPALSTVVAVQKPINLQELTFIDSSEMQGLFARCSYPIIVTFYSDHSGSVIGAPIRINADDAGSPRYSYVWHAGKGTIPIAADAVAVSITHGQLTAVTDARVDAIYN